MDLEKVGFSSRVKVFFLSIPSRFVRGFHRSQIKGLHDEFFSSLSLFVRSGMSVRQALFSLQEEARSSSLRYFLTAIIGDVDQGVPLWKSLDQSGITTQSVVHLLRVGEQSGKLEANLHAVSVQLEKERLFRSKIRGALLYPGFVLVLALVVGISVSWFILPQLAGVFGQLRIELPILTRLLIQFGTFLSVYGVVAIPSFLAGLFFLFYFLFFFHRTRFIGQRILFFIPVIHMVLRNVEMARFGTLFGTLLDAGVSPQQALFSVRQGTSFVLYTRFYDYLIANIDSGVSFRQSFHDYPNLSSLVPVSVQQMVGVGEQSGNLPETLLQVGKLYEARTDSAMKSLTVLLEPILLVIVWLGVLGVALAVIMPIYSLVSGVGQAKHTSSNPVVVEEIVTGHNDSIQEVGVDEQVLPVVVLRLRVLPTGVGYLNVRSSGDLDADVVGRLNVGEEYEFIRRVDQWYEVVLDGVVSGWVFGEYVEEIDGSSLDPVEEASLEDTEALNDSASDGVGSDLSGNGELQQ